jgi:hypothetical protein
MEGPHASVVGVLHDVDDQVLDESVNPEEELAEIHREGIILISAEGVLNAIYEGYTLNQMTFVLGYI